MTIVRQEDHLIILIDYFFDFKDGILVLGYDLRIDAYTYFHLSPPLKLIQLNSGKIYQVKRKFSNKSDSIDEDSDDLIVEQKIKSVDESKLNPIEKIYFTNYINHKKKEPSIDKNENILLTIGTIKSIDPRVSILGPCFDLTVTSPNVNIDLIIRVQTNSFDVQDPICFLLKKIPSSQGWIFRILGFKNKQQTQDYLSPDYLRSKNQEINPIDFR